jgi:hypothetical protein
MTRKWMWAIAIAPIVLASGVVGANAYPIDVSTDRDVYPLGVPVTITIENIGNSTLYGMPSCSVFDESGELVQAFAFIAIVWELEPGETVTVVWDQTNLNSTRVSPGTYHIEAGFAGYVETVKIRVAGDIPIYTD